MEVTTKAILEISQVELISENFDDAEEHNANFLISPSII